MLIPEASGRRPSMYRGGKSVRGPSLRSHRPGCQYQGRDEACRRLLPAAGRRERPVASGGALYPLHFWVLGSDGDAAMRQVLSIDHDRGEVKKHGEISVAHLQQMFVPDPGVAMAIDRGAAVIVIAADPRRITYKYGSRGWRYALMECGSGHASHHADRDSPR